jgi:hypothetical protein
LSSDRVTNGDPRGVDGSSEGVAAPDELVQALG